MEQRHRATRSASTKNWKNIARDVEVMETIRQRTGKRRGDKKKTQMNKNIRWEHGTYKEYTKREL